MNILNRFSNLDDDYNDPIDDNMNSFKPNKKSMASKASFVVEDTNNISTTKKEFHMTDQLFPSLTKTVKPVTNCLSFSTIFTTKKQETPNTNVLEEEEEEVTNMDKDCFVAVFNKKTRRLQLPPPPKQKTEEEVMVELSNNILNELNALHIRRSKEYLLAWGEDEYIKTFLAKEDVELCPFLKN